MWHTVGAMTADELLHILGYDESSNFLRGDQLAHAGDQGHAFRQAQDHLGLHGAYVLRPVGGVPHGSVVPLVYVCDARDEEEAHRVHRLVWNQNIVPFLIVRTPKCIRLYSGFCCDHRAKDESSGMLRAAIQFNEAASALSEFKDRAIESGELWQRWSKYVTPRTRLDWKLLGNLKKLGERLRESGLSRRHANALIGKYVFLHYLRAREILSDRRLATWGIDPEQVFSRGATLKAFYALSAHLHDWLNGSVFPLSTGIRRALRSEHLRRVAGTFAGDQADGQLHLDFSAYDFSYIPIETLSEVYEQFLHSQEAVENRPSGRERGAYYTPIALVDYMVNQMETIAPFSPGMKVLDPACGSGAFLVQCFRRLIERKLQEQDSLNVRPVELRELLTSSIFGVDSDIDACQVTELSLLLTMLDYVDPPDLQSTRFKLPTLRDQNIFCCDAFDLESKWAQSKRGGDYDWVIGNPPWREFKKKQLAESYPYLARWLAGKQGAAPMGDNQIAEAFMWRACELAAQGGIVAFLLPAMTLFKHASQEFRSTLFQTVELQSVANFSNLAEVLFAGRSRVPAAALFCQVPREESRRARRPVLTYSPFVANQEANRPRANGQRTPVWSLAVNASELRAIPYREIVDGDSLPWKLAMWGTSMDRRLLANMSHRHPPLETLRDAGRLLITEGLQLRGCEQTNEDVEHHPELVDKPRLLMNELKGLSQIFEFPDLAFETIPSDLAFIRKRGGLKPLQVCEPPHIIVNAARTFAVFSDRFIIVPPRQIGIAADTTETDFLKALSLYLSSDFTRYHQLLNSTELGVKRPRSTLRTLLDLPIAITDMDADRLAAWVDLHARLVEATRALFALPPLQNPRSSQSQFSLVAASESPLPDVRAQHHELMSKLLTELNQLVYDALGLGSRHQALVHDLVHVKMALDDGKLGSEAVRRPTDSEIEEHAEMLRVELDQFVDGPEATAHNISIMTDEHSGMIAIELVWSNQRKPIEIERADTHAVREFVAVRERLLERQSQWVYFNRDLRIYEDERVYLFKPMQRIHWTRSQALVDAGEIIAETLVGTTHDRSGIVGQWTGSPGARARGARTETARPADLRAPSFRMDGARSP